MLSRSRSRSAVASMSSAVLLALSLSACGSATSSAGEFAAPDSERRGSSDEIVAWEIREIDATHQTAYDAIQNLRPQWLRTRPARSLSNTTPTQPIVYVDRTRFGALRSLYQIDSRSVRRLVHLDGLDATTRYGTGHGGGVIEIYTR